jgi:hypothetical protein
MPRGMNTFEMPRVPEKVDGVALAASRDLLARSSPSCGRGHPSDEPAGPRVRTDGIDAAVLDAHQPGCSAKARSRSSSPASGAFASRRPSSRGCGVAFELDADGQLLHDWLEAAPVPGASSARQRSAASAPALAEGRLAARRDELAGARRRDRRALADPRAGGRPPHVVNLTLLR